jgi:hypothetical protein
MRSNRVATWGIQHMLAVLTALYSFDYSHFYGFENRCKNVQQYVTSLLLCASFLNAVWYSDLNLSVSVKLPRVAVVKQQFVHVTSWNRYICWGLVDVTLHGRSVVLNKRQWVWVRGRWVLGVNEAWSYCYGCSQVQSNPLSVSFLSSSQTVVCVRVYVYVFLGVELGWVQCVSVVCEPTLNIPARKAGSDTSYY